MARFVRKPVHTEVCDRISTDPDGEAMHALLGYNNRSGQRPRVHAHPGTDRSHSQRTESRGTGVGRKRHSIDRRDNDRDVTSSVVCVHDEVECHLAIAEVLSQVGTCGKETLGPKGGQGILMAEWSEV